MSSNSTEISPDWPAPRLCHLVKWDHFDGYGFNLHAEKNKAGQFIGKVDAGSPAEAAGLRNGDRIIEVNNVNIANENHKQVVERIKAVPNETKLLVLDPEADKFYKERKIIVKNSQSNVVYQKSPDGTKEEVNSTTTTENNEIALSNNKIHVDEDAIERLSQKSNKTGNGSHSSTPSVERKENDGSVHSVEGERPNSNLSGAHSSSSNQASPKSDKEEFKPNTSTASTESPQTTPKSTPKQSPEPSTASPKPSPKHSPAPNPKTNGNDNVEPSDSTRNGTVNMNGSPPRSPTSTANGEDKLNLNMTAQEMRALLAEKSRKKMDPRNDSMDLRQKYKIIQSM